MNIFVLPYKDVAANLPLELKLSRLTEYLNGGRQDVLENSDIFCENVRTINRQEKDFSLFQRANSVEIGTVVVFPIYLELFEFEGLRDNIFFVIKTYCEMFPNNKVVFYWNHDNDFAQFNEFVEKYPNCIIINYNTSKKSKNDIIVPFWSMDDTSFIKEDKNNFACFFGTLNHSTRVNLINSIRNKEGYKIGGGLNNKEYRKELSRSLFGLCPRGVGLSSYRFFECIHTNTIPVLLGDQVVLPYEDELDYSKFSVRIPECRASDFNFIDKALKALDNNKMLEELEKQRPKFTLAGVQQHIYSKLS